MSTIAKPTVLNLSIPTLRAQYVAGTLTPRQLIESLLPLLEAEDTHRIWISRLDRSALFAYADALADRDPVGLPLYGIPFAIKDNIDLAGLPTTAACPNYSYAPTQHATVVQRLIDAGAIPIGKTNLDQFATGLVGTRSPHGAVRNALHPEYISGGSSSGSAVAVALGLASFSLGTDTAGSGRVPAMLNNLVGLKPTLGLLSGTGVVPACKTLDTISIFGLTAADTATVCEVAAGYDETDPYSRPADVGPLPLISSGKNGNRFRFGVPAAKDLQYFGNQAGPERFAAACAALEQLGGQAVEIDFAPFLETARLLYEGPWVAERYAAIAEFIEEKPTALFPVTHQIISKARQFDAVSTFKAQYRLQHLRRETSAVWQHCDVIITPTAGTTYTISELEANPVELNSNLGYYTNFMNLLNYAAVAVPAGFQPNGLPFGVTLFAPEFSEIRLLSLAAQLHSITSELVGATSIQLADCGDGVVYDADASVQGYVDVAVCGAHMQGLPLNHALVKRGAQLVETTRSSADYCFYVLAGGPPKRPGMVRSAAGGASIELEIWRLPVAQYGSFVATIPAPLGIGTVQLIDGRTVQGFICEAITAEQAVEITHLKSWRHYLASTSST